MTSLSEAELRLRGDIAEFETAWWWPLTVAAISIVIVACAILGPRLVSRSVLASVIEDTLCPRIGVECRVAGPIHLRLIPIPAIEANGLSVRDGERRPAMSAARVVAELRALPLLVGRISVSHLDFDGARFDFDAPAGGMRLLAAADGAGTALLDKMAAADGARHRLTRIGVARSEFVIRAASGTQSLVVNDVSGLLAWPQGGGALAARIAGFVGRERVELRLDGPAFADLTRIEGSRVSMEAVLGGNILSFAGRLVETKDIVAAGVLRVALPSVRRVAAWLEPPGWPSWLPDTNLRFGGPAFISSRGVDLDNADFEAGLSRFTGVLSLRSTTDGRPALLGTLAASLVDLGDLAALPGSEFVLPELARMPDLDLRLSVRRLMAKGARIDAVAAGLILAGGRLDLTVSQGLPGGTDGKLRLVAKPDEDGLALKAQASGESIDIGAVMSAFSPRAALSGTGALAVVLEGRGGDIGTLARSLMGKASLQMKGGLLSLDDDGTPVGSVSAGASGKTVTTRAFSEASFAGVADRGVLALTEGRIGGGASQILVDGKIDIAARSLDLSLSGVDSARADSPWRVRAVGPWSAPVLWRQPAR